MVTSSRISKTRSGERERLRGPPWVKAVQGALLTGTYTVLDYAQTGLIASVFFFKMMEWWYQSAEERMSAPTMYPPPPPPPSPQVAKEGQEECNHCKQVAVYSIIVVLNVISNLTSLLRSDSKYNSVALVLPSWWNLFVWC